MRSAGRYRLVTYRRRGFGSSPKAERPLTIQEQAADCLGLIGHLRLDPVHLVGHSLDGARSNSPSTHRRPFAPWRFLNNTCERATRARWLK
jgi:hypothetical protein